MITEKLRNEGYAHNSDIKKGWIDPVNVYTFGNVKLMFGNVSVKTSTASGSSAYFPYYGYTSVNFPYSFTNTPKVVCNPLRHGGWWAASCTAITTTGFTARIAGDVNNASTDMWWVAIGV